MVAEFLCLHVVLTVDRSGVHKQRTQRLAAILKRRAAIEKSILAIVERLEAANNQAANELNLTVAGRVRFANKQDEVAQNMVADD